MSKKPSKPSVYFSPESLRALKANTYMSPETLHKINNPFCGVCMAERGRAFLAEMNRKKSEG